jgi:hypothetical protein
MTPPTAEQLDRLAKDVLAYIEAQSQLMAALRVGGRTPEKVLHTLGRLGDVPGRFRNAAPALIAEAREAAPPTPHRRTLECGRALAAARVTPPWRGPLESTPARSPRS